MGHWVQDGPSRNSQAVVTSDTAAQPVGRGLFVGTGGTITGRLVEDSVDTVWKNLVSGQDYALAFQYIRATGTTAADMLILF
jgi:hypothetical protein